MKNFIKKMIAIIPVSALSFVGSINTAAQNGELGFRYMPTISDFDMSVSEGGLVQAEAIVGYGIGAFMGVNFTDNVGLQGELIYNSLSQKYVEQDTETRVDLQYINIPILLSLNTGKSNPFNFNVVVGPQLGLSVGSDVTTTNQGYLEPDPIIVVKSTDFGIAYGAGIDFGLTPGQDLRLGLGYRGVIGLVDISDNSNTNETDQYYILEKTGLNTYSIYIGLSLLFD